MVVVGVAAVSCRIVVVEGVGSQTKLMRSRHAKVGCELWAMGRLMNSPLLGRKLCSHDDCVVPDAGCVLRSIWSESTKIPDT